MSIKGPSGYEVLAMSSHDTYSLYIYEGGHVYSRV
jgi:hypothetical protein